MPHNDTASAIVSVLIIIVVITLVAGSVLAYATLQHRFFARDVQLLEARYAAEAAVYEALSRMNHQSPPEPQEINILFENGASGEAVVAVHGSYSRITGNGRKGRQRVTINVLAGLSPGTAFSDAIHTMDPHAGLVLAGSTTVIGDVRTGSPGVRTERFHAQPFTGTFEGEALPPGLDISFSDHVRALFDTWRIIPGDDRSLLAEALILEGNHDVPYEPDTESDDATGVRTDRIVITGDATLPPRCRLRRLSV